MSTSDRLRTITAIGLPALGGLAVAGCGGAGATKTVTVTETAAAPPTSSVTTAAAATTSAATTSAATTSGRKGGTVKLLGAPALIHTSQRYYMAAVRLLNTSDEMKTVTVQFDGLHGSKVLDSQTDVRTIPPGEGLSVSQLELPKGTRARASISVEESLGFDDDAVAATKINGKPKFTPGQYGDCTLSVQIKNASAKKLSLVGIFLVALRHGKIVSAGYDFPDVNPHLTALSKASFVPCATKIDTVRAYVEG
jgi:hypothetical protein